LARDPRVESPRIKIATERAARSASPQVFARSLPLGRAPSRPIGRPQTLSPGRRDLLQRGGPFFHTSRAALRGFVPCPGSASSSALLHQTPVPCRSAVNADRSCGSAAHRAFFSFSPTPSGSRKRHRPLSVHRDGFRRRDTLAASQSTTVPPPVLALRDEHPLEVAVLSRAGDPRPCCGRRRLSRDRRDSVLRQRPSSAPSSISIRNRSAAAWPACFCAVSWSLARCRLFSGGFS